jgi:20S proteasome alpha/beta subunit
MPSPFELHGGTVVAMKGKDAVCIATDLRLGEGKMVNVATNVQKVSQYICIRKVHL